MTAPSRIVCVALVALAAVAEPRISQAQFTTGDLAGLVPREIGPATVSGRIVDLAVVESNTSTFYVATSTGGVWKTMDNGIRYTPVFFGEAVHSVGDVEVHQKDTAVVWVGTGERASRQSSGWGDGVYKSTDGGRTWKNMGLRDSRHIGRIAMHPGNSDVVYVAAMGHLWGPNEERGIYKSVDGGSTWKRVLFVDSLTGAVDVAIDPVDPKIMYAAMYQRQRRPWGFHGGGPGSGLYKSIDGGDSWTRLTNTGSANGLPTGDMGRIGITLHRRNPRILYVSVEQGERYNASTAYQKAAGGIFRSDDRGETWKFQSTWNPRPMYASQPVVDPNDPDRLYMLNSYSFSNDGGRTFSVPRDHRTHGDDRFVWVNPNDSRHVLKADDGGLGISYDRGEHFLFATNLPVSQWYRVAVDMAHPYNIYGGLQDNGSLAGPNQTYREEGILNEDWVRWGGGDGFLSLVDTTNNRILYSESQYLGLLRSDIVTGQVKDIRPNQPEGFIGDRRNWTTWPDPGSPDQRLGNAMPPGNWEGPFIISPHDPTTLYAGLNELFKSTDRGDTWRSLGNLTANADRRAIRIMEQKPDSFTLSLDDGIPYWPTLTAVAESEFTPGVLYVGTDDGQVQVTRDDGRTWVNVTSRIPGLPDMAWINGIVASTHRDGRLWLVANNYRNDDYANYAWRSDDSGMSWVSVVGDLPADRVTRRLHEDPRNPDVLYLGTEFGVFWSWNGGTSWVELRSGLPTVAVNDLLVHPRDNDLVLATHGRGLWVLDQVSALQEMTPQIATKASHLFSVDPVEQVRYRSERSHTGNMIFEGANPPAAAILDYWVRDRGTPVSITVFDSRGAEVTKFQGSSNRGVNRALWDLRYAWPLEAATTTRRATGSQGVLVVPGLYTVQLTAGGVSSEQVVRVRDDPRLADMDPGVRARWTQDLIEITSTLADAQIRSREVADALRKIEVGEVRPAAGVESKVRDLNREFSELVSRTSGLRSAVEAWTGPLSADQASQKAFFAEMLATLSREWDAAKARVR